MEIIERQGKPCCINMISEDDRRFLSNLDKAAKREAKVKAKTEAAVAAEGQGSAIDESGEMADTKIDAAKDSEDEIDEIEQFIIQQTNLARDLKRQEMTQSKLALQEEEKNKVKAKKMDKLVLLQKDEERDVLDSRSMPTRQYMMETVVPHITEGFIQVCKKIPDDPTQFLCDFLKKRADEIDKKIIKSRESKMASRRK